MLDDLKCLLHNAIAIITATCNMLAWCRALSVKLDVECRCGNCTNQPCETKLQSVAENVFKIVFAKE